MRSAQELQKNLNSIIQDLDFPSLYKSYQWENDTWTSGFPDMLRLEKEISAAAKNESLQRDHLVKIAKWGKLPNIDQIKCPTPIKIALYQNNIPIPELSTNPQNIITTLRQQIFGFGPTYMSKLLHFAVPQVCGALDTRLVRVFGRTAQQYPILDLYAQQESNGRWWIPATQSGWPREYKIWVLSLKIFADYLNENQIRCPHSSKYIQEGLRTDGIWFPADVETALFAYASMELKDTKNGFYQKC